MSDYQPTPPPSPYTTTTPASDRTNVLAIIALIGAFVLPLAGIICGHIALGQIKRTGEKGHGLALAGTILGYVFVLLYVILIIGSVVLAGLASTIPTN